MTFFFLYAGGGGGVVNDFKHPQVPWGRYNPREYCLKTMAQKWKHMLQGMHVVAEDGVMAKKAFLVMTCIYQQGPNAHS